VQCRYPASMDRPGSGGRYAAHMMELLLPETDAAVGLQAILAIIILTVGFRLTRSHPDWRVFWWGLLVITTAGFGLRALH